MRRMTSWLLPCLLAILPAAASAAMIEVSAPSGPSPVGTTISFQIVGSDFADGTDGGDFSVSWTSNLQYAGISIPDPPWDAQAYDDSTAALGYLDFVDVFSFSTTPGGGAVDFAIATLTLVGVGEGPGSVSLYPSLVGWSLGGDTLPDVTYGQASVTIAAPAPVPLPAAGLLLASGGGLLLGGFRRTRRRLSTVSS